MTGEFRGLSFVKASACGNDFILIEAEGFTGDLTEVTKTICDRTRGVGADGVEWLYKSGNGDIRAHLINSDGSYAEISGNGTRCVAAYLASKSGKDSIKVETGAGVKICTLTERNGKRFRFRTEMGVPDVRQPFNLQLGTGDLRGVPVSMGNPHFVTFVSTFPQNWQAISAEVQKAEEFPESTNVEFVNVINDSEIEIRIFERGAGETLSSGTGSSAAAAAAIATGRAHGTVIVHSPGGAQTVEWDTQLILDGPAELICTGEYFL